MLKAHQERPTDQRERDMTKTQADKVRAAILDALAHGWERIPASPGVVSLRFQVERETPEYAREAGWWPGETYTELTFVNFIGVERISAIVKEARVPWIARQDRKVSVKRALERLAELRTERAAEPAQQN
jgi:hypothetical protein